MPPARVTCCPQQRHKHCGRQRADAGMDDAHATGRETAPFGKKSRASNCRLGMASAIPQANSESGRMAQGKSRRHGQIHRQITGRGDDHQAYSR